MYSEKSIKEYLKELASKSPAPGGGSAAALVGAIGAALLSKVANFTIGNEKYKDAEKEISNILGRSEALRENFNNLCSEDATAYKKLSDAFRLPKGEERRKEIQSALKEALRVPLAVCKSAHEAIRLCAPLVKKGNVNLITDVGDSALMLHSAFHAALLNVEINLKGIKDNEFIIRTRKTIEPMAKEVDAVNRGIAGIVEGGIR